MRILPFMGNLYSQADNVIMLLLKRQTVVRKNHLRPPPIIEIDGINGITQSQTFICRFNYYLVVARRRIVWRHTLKIHLQKRNQRVILILSFFFSEAIIDCRCKDKEILNYLVRKCM